MSTIYSNSKNYEEKGPYPLTKLVAWFHNFGRFFLFVPFTLQIDPHSGQYKAKRHGVILRFLVFLQQTIILLAGLSYILCNPIFGAENKSWSEFTKKATATSALMWLLNPLNLFCHLWKDKRDTLEKVLKQLDDLLHSFHCLGVKSPGLKLVRFHYIVLIFIFLLWGFLEMARDVEMHHQDWRIGVRQLVGYVETWPDISAIFIRGNDRRPLLGETTVNLNDTTPFSNVGYFIVVTWGFMLAEYALHFADVLSFLYAALLYVLVFYFIKFLKETPAQGKNDGVKFNLALKIFDNLCDISETMNADIGAIVLLTCFVLIPYYSFKLRKVFEGDFMDVLQFIIYAVYIGSTLFLAAEANSMLHTFIRWLCHHHEGIKFNDPITKQNFKRNMALALNQIEARQVGLRGKCFTITYGFVGNMASLLVTYSIIIFQLQSV